jgi:hypothetical protein
MSAPDRRTRLDVRHKKPLVRRQCALLGPARSGVYRAPAPARGQPGGDAPNRCGVHRPSILWLAADRLYAEGEPQAGATADAADGPRLSGPKPRTSTPAPGHRIYPYLLLTNKDTSTRRPTHETSLRRTSANLRGPSATKIPVAKGHPRSYLFFDCRFVAPRLTN